METKRAARSRRRFDRQEASGDAYVRRGSDHVALEVASVTRHHAKTPRRAVGHRGERPGPWDVTQRRVFHDTTNTRSCAVVGETMNRTLRPVLLALIGVLFVGCLIPAPAPGWGGWYHHDRIWYDGDRYDHHRWHDRDRDDHRDRDRDHGRGHR
jgi:hypothetical protein